MSNLLDKYQQYYKRILEHTEKLDAIELELAGIQGKKDCTQNELQEFEGILEALAEWEILVRQFQKRAERCLTSTNVLTIEIPKNYSLNMDRLKGLAAQIDLRRLDDPFAKRLYEEAETALKFMARLKDTYKGKIAEEESARGQDDSVTEEKRLQGEKSEEISQIHNILAEHDFTELKHGVRTENLEYDLEHMDPEYTEPKTSPLFWNPGALGYPFPVIDEERGDIKEAALKYFDGKTKTLYFPMNMLCASDEFLLVVDTEGTKSDMDQIDSGLRSLMVQMIQKSPMGERRLYVLDAKRKNANLLGALLKLEDSFIMGKVPKNDEQLTEAVDALISLRGDIDERLDNFKTVEEYNLAAEESERIERSVLFIVGGVEDFAPENRNAITNIILSAKKYGMSVIWVTNLAKEDMCKEYARETGVILQCIDKQFYLKAASGSEDEEKKTPFLWYSFSAGPKNTFVDSIVSRSTPQNRRSDQYSDYVDVQENEAQPRNAEETDLLVGVNCIGEGVSIGFKEDHHITYLIGGNHKSRGSVTNVLLAGLVKNYHPDDVELWMMDYDSSLGWIRNHMPIHTRVYNNNPDREVVMDILRHLAQEVTRRMQEEASSAPAIYVFIQDFTKMLGAAEADAELVECLKTILGCAAQAKVKVILSAGEFADIARVLGDWPIGRPAQYIYMNQLEEQLKQPISGLDSDQKDLVMSWISKASSQTMVVQSFTKTGCELRRLRAVRFERDESLYRLVGRINELYKLSEDNAEADKEHYTRKDVRILTVDRADARMDDPVESAMPEAAPEEPVAPEATPEENMMPEVTPEEIVTEAASETEESNSEEKQQQVINLASVLQQVAEQKEEASEPQETLVLEAISEPEEASEPEVTSEPEEEQGGKKKKNRKKK